MAPKIPGLKPVNLVTGATVSPPLPPPPIPPTTVPRGFVPVVSDYGGGSSTRQAPGSVTPSRSGDGFQLSDIVSVKRVATII